MFDEAAHEDKFGVQPSRWWTCLRSWATPATTWRVCPVGKKGAIDFSLPRSAVRRTARPGWRPDAAQVPGGAPRAPRRCAPKSRSSPSAPTFPSMESRNPALSRGSRERCYELFSRLAFRTLVNDYAPTADTSKRLRDRRDSSGARRAGSPIARGGRVCAPDRR